MSYDPLPAALAISRIIRASGKSTEEYLEAYPDVACLAPRPGDSDTQLEAFHKAFAEAHNFSDIKAMVENADLRQSGGSRKPRPERLGPSPRLGMRQEYTKFHPRTLEERKYLSEAGRGLGAVVAERRLNIADVAKPSGYTTGYVARIFRGESDENYSLETLRKIAENGLESDLETALAQGKEILAGLKGKRPFQEIIESYCTNNGVEPQLMGAIMFPDAVNPKTRLYSFLHDSPPTIKTQLAVLRNLGYGCKEGGVPALEEAAKRSTPENRDPRLVRLLEEATKKKSLVDAEDARRRQQPGGGKSL